MSAAVLIEPTGESRIVSAKTWNLGEMRRRLDSNWPIPFITGEIGGRAYLAVFDGDQRSDRPNNPLAGRIQPDMVVRGPILLLGINGGLTGEEVDSLRSEGFFAALSV